MSDITDFYQQQALAGVSDIPWLAQMQNSALVDFERLGFPTRKDEDWKYTSVEGFLKQRFYVPRLDRGTQGSNFKARSMGPAVEPREFGDLGISGHHKDIPIRCNNIALVNGVVMGDDSLVKTLPAGVVVLPLAQALVSHADKIKACLGQILKQEHAFQALNTAMMQSGLFIYLPEGVCLAEPLLLSHWQDQSQQASHIRHLVIAEARSSAVIIEDYQGDASSEYFTNTITEVHTAAHAAITHYKIQREGKLACHVGHLAVNQAEHSRFDSHLFSFGGKLVRSDVTFNLMEPHARCFMNGIYAPAEGQHMDHHTLVTHAVPDCSSAQDYKGILTGHSRAVFNGKVVVAKDAQHTEAKQQNKNLLLSVGAEIDTKPQLEIFADDVVCTHGATVGQLDEEALFYLATRGIEHAEASHYLIQAFAAENLRAITDANLATWLSGLLNQQIG